MTKEITDVLVYLAPKKILAVGDIVDSDNLDIQSSVYSDTTIELTVPIMTVTDPCIVAGVSNIESFLLPEDPPFGEMACIFGLPNITWERGIVENEFGIISRNEYLTVQFENPSTRCYYLYWVSSYVTVQNPMEITWGTPFIQISRTGPTPGEIPTDPESKLDYVMSGIIDATSTYSETGLMVTPGELINLHWKMIINDTTYEQIMMSVYFSTPLFTGGKILSVSEIEENPLTRRYSVQVEGITYENVLPMDLADYQVDEWVFLLKQNTSGNTYLRTTAYSSTNDDVEADELRLIPYTFFMGPSPYMPFEYDDFNMFMNFDVYEYCYFNGVMEEDATTNTGGEVLVELPASLGGWTSYTGVQIFYNCDNASTSFGYASFRTGEEVIVLCERASGTPTSDDLTIIGFKDSLKACVLIVEIDPETVESYEEAIITILNGTPPYTFVVDPEIGFVATTPISGTDNTFIFVGEGDGSTTITVEDVNGIIGEVDVLVTLEIGICCTHSNNLVVNGCMELETGWFISDWGYIIDPELCPSPEYSAEEYYEGTRSILCTAEPNGSSGNYYFHSFYVQNVPIEVTGTYTVSSKYKIVSLPTPTDLETPHDSHFAINCILRDENEIFIENVWLPSETTVDYDEVVSEWVGISGNILAEAGTHLEISFGVSAFSEDTTRPEVYVDDVCVMSFSISISSPVFIGEKTEIHVYGGTSPYTFGFFPYLGSILEEDEKYYFIPTHEGDVVITCTDSLGVEATADLEIRINPDEDLACTTDISAGTFLRNGELWYYKLIRVFCPWGTSYYEWSFKIE